MGNGTTFAGILLAALGVAVGLRGVFHSDSAAMIALGACGAAVGLVLIFRGHYRR